MKQETSFLANVLFSFFKQLSMWFQHVYELLCKTVHFNLDVILMYVLHPFLLLKILDDPSPSLLNKNFSPEFCSFVDTCLQKDPAVRPTADKVSDDDRFFTLDSGVM